MFKNKPIKKCITIFGKNINCYKERSEKHELSDSQIMTQSYAHGNKGKIQGRRTWNHPELNVSGLNP